MKIFLVFTGKFKFTILGIVFLCIVEKIVCKNIEEELLMSPQG